MVLSVVYKHTTRKDLVLVILVAAVGAVPYVVLWFNQEPIHLAGPGKCRCSHVVVDWGRFLVRDAGIRACYAVECPNPDDDRERGAQGQFVRVSQ
mmetsp:Transcript_94761/g.253470  ORF Transcript_94761/g.253470 Transcript_94761/m.253470 type:complete len:95 (+) Transcript_94761:230-514(+)